MPDPAPTRSRRGCGCGTLVLGCLGVVVLLVVAVIGVGVFVWWQWTSVPDYWETQRARMEQLTPAERDQHAEAVEHRFSSWLSDASHASPDTNFAASEARSAPAEPADRSLSLTFDELNAWLDRRMESWAAQRDVDLDLPVRDLIVTSEDGKLLVAGDVQLPQLNQVVSAVVDAHLLPDGDLHVHVQRVRIGRVPLPADVVARLARDNLPPHQQTEAVQRVLEVFEGTTITPVFKPDGRGGERELRLTRWEVDDEGVELTVTTSPTPAESE